MRISVPRRLANPERPARKRSGARKRATQKNPAGELITLGFLNPQKGAKPVSKSKTKKKHHARAKNPATISRPRSQKNPHRKTRRARNPQIMGAISKPIDMLKAGLFALLGFVASRQIPQVALKDKNAGIMGYGSNLGVALGGGYLAGKFISKPAGVAVGIGGALYAVSRVLNEQFSPVGNYLKLAGVGDAAAAPSMGRLKAAYFPFPVVRNANGDPLLPAEIDARAALAALAPAPAGPSKLAGANRMSAGSRFAA